MTETLRDSVRDRAKNCCEYCRAQAEFSHDPFCVEHIWPRAKGGDDQSENLAWACLGCNFHKFTATHGVDLVSGQFASLFHPRQDDWAAHFKWNDDFTRLDGLTATGRATISKLQLNRKGLVNHRLLLIASKKHPPF